MQNNTKNNKTPKNRKAQEEAEYFKNLYTSIYEAVNEKLPHFEQIAYDAIDLTSGMHILLSEEVKQWQEEALNKVFANEKRGGKTLDHLPVDPFEVENLKDKLYFLCGLQSFLIKFKKQSDYGEMLCKNNGRSTVAGYLVDKQTKENLGMLCYEYINTYDCVKTSEYLSDLSFVISKHQDDAEMLQAYSEVFQSINLFLMVTVQALSLNQKREEE